MLDHTDPELHVQQTHAAVEVVSRFSDFLPQEVDDLLNAAVTNTQISWILEDHDVYHALLGARGPIPQHYRSRALAQFWETLEEMGWGEKFEE